MTKWRWGEEDVTGKIYTRLKTTSDCYSDIQNWMTQNKLQLNSVTAHCTLSKENFISQTAKSCY